MILLSYVLLLLGLGLYALGAWALANWMDNAFDRRDRRAMDRFIRNQRGEN